MELKALNNNLILIPDVKSNKTSSGIILSTKNEEVQNVGIVFSVGKKVVDIKKGDKVMYKEYSGSKFEFGDDKYVVINADDALAIVK